MDLAAIQSVLTQRGFDDWLFLWPPPSRPDCVPHFRLAAGAGRLVLKASAEITGRVQSDLVVI